MEDWIPLVERVGDRFVLSKAIVDLAGTFWGYWEIQKFVCHVITHFDDPLEHVLDDPQGILTRTFDIDTTFAEYFSERYSQEFVPLSPQWYTELLRAKLATLRIPVSLVIDYQVAFLCKSENHQAMCRAIESMAATGLLRGDSRVDLERIGEVSAMAPADAWRIILAEVEPLIEQGVIPRDTLWDLYEG